MPNAIRLYLHIFFSTLNLHFIYLYILQSNKLNRTITLYIDIAHCANHTCTFDAFCRPCDVLLGLLTLDVCIVVPLECGISFNTFPTALVRPSLNTILCPGFMYSGCLINLKCTKALSPVLKQSWDMDNIEAVCLMLPQCTATTICHDYTL